MDLLKEVKEKIEQGSKKPIIQKAIQHENRLKFHAECYLERGDFQDGGEISRFLAWVKDLLPKDKAKIFEKLFRFPLSTVEFVADIFDELEKVFDARNPSYVYQFKDSENLADWTKRLEETQDAEFWRVQGWQAVKTDINSVLIVDLPSEKSDKAEPYYYLLDIANVLDYGFEKGEITYIIFKQPDNKIAYFTKEAYITFNVEDGEPVSEELNVPHDLGYCPASFFWYNFLNSAHKDLKKSPISTQLYNLEWLLFFSISKKHLDLYAPYPIYSSYEPDCEFENLETQDYCDGGYLRRQDGQYAFHKITGERLLCPQCQNKKLIGPGSEITVPPPKSKEDPDLSNPVNITSIDKDSLEYNVEEIKRLETHIFDSVVGVSSDVQKKQSVNEAQVFSNYQSKINALNNIKYNFEKIIKFAHDTCCKLRYKDSFISSSISLGTDFYIVNSLELRQKYKIAKDAGATEAELDDIETRIAITENRNNTIKVERMRILRALEPYKHKTFSELMQLMDKGLIDTTLLKVKLSFSEYIERFERENTNILEFGKEVEFDKKIEKIKNQLYTYGKETIG